MQEQGTFQWGAVMEAQQLYHDTPDEANLHSYPDTYVFVILYLKLAKHLEWLEFHLVVYCLVYSCVAL